MRYTRPHMTNGVRHQKGDAFQGGIRRARRLYHRGILEPDGSPEDALIIDTEPITQTWHDGQEYQQEE